MTLPHSADTVSARLASRMPTARSLNDDGVRVSDLARLVGRAQGTEWLIALERLQLATACSPAAVRATSALALDAIARILRTPDAPTPFELAEGMHGLHYITGHPERSLMCMQLLLLAEVDAKGPPDEPDLFAELTAERPRQAMTLILLALTVLTH